MPSPPPGAYFRWAGACLVAAALSAGCASRGRLAVHTEQQPGQSSIATRASSHDTGTLEDRDLELRALRLSLALAPTAENHRLVAEVYAARGVLDAAYEHFVAALRLAPRDAATLDGLARVWRDWGFSNLGLTQAHRAVFHAPSSAAARNTLGSILLKLGLPAEARLAFESVLTLDPRAAYPLNNLCYVYLLEGRPLQAIDACREALARQPGLTAAQNNLALAYAATGDMASASREFAHAGGAGAASYNLGIAFMAVGDYSSAGREFDRAASLTPSLKHATSRATLAWRMASQSTSPATDDAR